MREARTPTATSGNEQAESLVLDLAKRQAERALEKMHDPKLALADKLTSTGGTNAYSNNADAHSRTVGIHATNDSVENTFATAN